MELISCKDAKARGLRHYFTGKPCKHGHIALRFVTGGCIVCQKEHCRKSHARNYDKRKEETYEWRNNNRERTREIQRNYYSRNSEQIRANQCIIRANRLHRVPPWSEEQAIEEFYANYPDGMQVDHIIPLQGELVSGLHVLSNLQYLTESENKAKRNHIDLDELNK